MLHTKFHGNWLNDSGEEYLLRFLCWPFLSCDLDNYANFLFPML